MENNQRAATHTPSGFQHQSKMLRGLAIAISYVCHPVFMPAVMAFVLYMLSPVIFASVSKPEFGKWMSIIILDSVFFPLIVIALLKGLGFIQSIQLRDQKDRIIPLIATMMFYFWTSHVFNNIPGVPSILKMFLLGCFWGVIAVFMINIFFKVSMHAAGAGSMLGILVVLMLMPDNRINIAIALFIGLIIAGIIGTARMILGAHKTGQLWLGYIIGILVQLGAYWYFK